MKPLIGSDITTMNRSQLEDYVSKRRLNRTIRFGRKKKIEGKATVAKLSKMLNLNQQIVLDLIDSIEKK